MKGPASPIPYLGFPCVLAILACPRSFGFGWFQVSLKACAAAGHRVCTIAFRMFSTSMGGLRQAGWAVWAFCCTLVTKAMRYISSSKRQFTSVAFCRSEHWWLI